MSGYRITRIIAASLLALAVVPILVIALESGFIISRSVEASVRGSLTAITRAIALEAERSIRPAWRILDSLSIFMAQIPDERSARAFIEATQRARSEITALILLDAEGKILALSPPAFQKLDYDFSGLPEYRKARESSGFTFSRPYLSSIDGSVTVAAYRRLGDKIGLVLLDLEDISRYLDSLRLSEQDHVAVIDDDRRVIAHSDMIYVREQRYLDEPPPPGIIDESIHDDGTYLVTSSHVRGTGWRVVYHRNEREAHAMLFEFLLGMGIVAGLSLTAAIAAAFYINRSLSQPFSRIAMEARALASGEYGRRIHGNWPLELETIARAFNVMSENIERRDKDLQKSEERYRSLFFGSEVPALLVDAASGRVRDANRAAIGYYGYRREELLELPIWRINTLPEEKVRAAMAATQAVPSVGKRYRFRHRLKDGTIRDVEVFSTPLEIDEEIFLYSIVFDITDRIRAEDQVRRDLEEKTVLLKEVHHRVKNNLQIVVSLLHLQSRMIRDPEDAVIFRASQDRVHSMALTHEILYQSKDLSSVDMGEYTERLMSYIKDAYPLPGLSIDTEIARFTLALEKAIPCGLIINELVTNACRHALPKAESPRLSLRLGSVNGQGAYLEVEDSGPGMPPDFDLARSNSLGMSLVYNLSQQLLGTVEFTCPHPESQHPGLLVRISFPVD